MLTGPNLPHNWVSHLATGESVPLRGRVLQFTEDFIGNAMALLPELAACESLLETSRRGALFSPATAEAAAPMLAELVSAQGIRRIEVFIGLLGLLQRAEVTTRENLKAEIIDKGILTAAELCVDRYAAGCAELGIK